MLTAHSEDVHALAWRHMLEGVDKAADYLELRESAARANGYLRCLTDVGMVNLGQRKSMAERITTLSNRRLEALRNAAAVSADPW